MLVSHDATLLICQLLSLSSPTYHLYTILYMHRSAKATPAIEPPISIGAMTELLSLGPVHLVFILCSSDTCYSTTVWPQSITGPLIETCQTSILSNYSLTTQVHIAISSEEKTNMTQLNMAQLKTTSSESVTINCQASNYQAFTDSC